MTTNTGVPPYLSTDPTPTGREREVDGLLRAAANLASVVLPMTIGEQVHHLLVVAYNTPDAEHYRALARSILAVCQH